LIVLRGAESLKTDSFKIGMNSMGYTGSILVKSD